MSFKFNPKTALDLMVSSSPTEVFQKLKNSGKISLIELLTFGMMNTAIFNTEDPDRKYIGYVTYWESKVETVTWIVDKTAILISEIIPAKHATPRDQCPQLFDKYYFQAVGKKQEEKNQNG